MNTREKQIHFWSGIGLLGTAVIWGFAFVVVKNSLDLIPPVYMMAFRFTIAAVMLAAIFCRRLGRMTKRIWQEGAVLGLLLFVSYLAQTIGCQYTTAGKNAFLTAVYVVLVPFLHWWLNKKKPDACCVTAAFLAIAGIGLLSLRGDMTMNIGDILTLICGFGFALHMIYIDRYTQQHDPVLLTILQLGFSAVYSWVLAPVLEGGFPKEAFNPDIVTGMLYLGIFSTMIGFLLQNVCQKYTTPNTASLLLSMESVFGVLFSVLLLQERFTGKMLAGCALIFLAIVMAETKFHFLPGISVFYPDTCEKSVYEIDFEALYREGYRGVIFDIDNTLVPHGAPADERAIALFKKLRETGLACCLLSNNQAPRVEPFAKKVRAEYIENAHKPSVRNYRSACEKMGTTSENTLFIGDQLFTDVYGAKRAKIRSILVQPLHPKEEIQIVLKRYLEKIVLYFYRRQA